MPLRHYVGIRRWGRAGDAENCGGQIGTGWRGRSTPSTIIRIIADNLFRRNRGECTAHSGLVAGNLVNVHVRIKPLAPVSAGRIEGKWRGDDTEGEWTRRGWRRAKSRVADVCPPRSIILTLLRHFRGNRILFPGSSARPRAPFFAFVIHE